MNKRLLVLSACLLAIGSSVALAQDSVIYLDNRPNSSASGVTTITGNLGSTATNPFLNDTVNAGRRGQGQIVYLEPKHADGWESVNSVQKNGAAFPNFDGDMNNSTDDLWIYMDVNDDASGTDDVISSVGLDIDTRFVAVTQVFRNKLASIDVTLDNTPSVFNSITPPGSGAPWNNRVHGGPAVNDPPDWPAAKAVRVPVDPGPVYNASLGIVPRAQGTTPSYRLGRIRLTSGTRNCTQRGNAVFTEYSTFDFYLTVNNLLITRVYNGAGDTVENVALGYGALQGSAVPDATISGNSAGTASGVADGRVVIRMKGDWNADGNVTSADNGGQVAAGTDATDNQLATYLGDFNGNTTSTSADLGSSGLGGALYLHALTRGGIPSCP
jgi:hypothetical protein